MAFQKKSKKNKETESRTDFYPFSKNYFKMNFWELLTFY